MEPLGSGLLPRLLSKFYGFAVQSRISKFAKNPSRAHRHAWPVISVGGIHAGGVGKTPLVGYIIEHLQAQGYCVALLSRGYKKPHKGSCIVKPGDNATWHITGDEPTMLRNRYPGLWLGIGANRSALAQQLDTMLPSKSVYLLDDGFSHQKMQRDVNIVCVPAQVSKTDILLPAGYLREPFSALQRATVICVMGSALEEDAILGRSREIARNFPGSSVCGFKALPGVWVNMNTLESRLTPLSHGSIALLTGIANPKRFVDMVDQSGISYDSVHSFDDHCAFKEGDIAAIVSSGTTTILTTEKDMIRLARSGVVKDQTIWYLTIQLTPVNESSSSAFLSVLDTTLSATFSSSGGFR